MIVLVRHECTSEEESGATQRARQSVAVKCSVHGVIEASVHPHTY